MNDYKPLMTSNAAHGYMAFARDRMVHGETLVCPVMVLWRDYTKYCGRWGFERLVADQFVTMLQAESGATIRFREGPGKLRKAVIGLGLKPLGENDE